MQQQFTAALEGLTRPNGELQAELAKANCKQRARLRHSDKKCGVLQLGPRQDPVWTRACWGNPATSQGTRKLGETGAQSSRGTPCPCLQAKSEFAFYRSEFLRGLVKILRMFVFSSKVVRLIPQEESNGLRSNEVCVFPALWRKLSKVIEVVPQEPAWGDMRTHHVDSTFPRVVT